MVHKTTAPVALTGIAKSTYLKSKTFQLKLNGQSRHLDGAGIDRVRACLANAGLRIVPFSNTNSRLVGSRYPAKLAFLR